MNLLLFWEDFDSAYLFLFLFNHGIEDELDVAYELGSDMLAGLSVVAAGDDGVVVVESEISQV